MTKSILNNDVKVEVSDLDQRASQVQNEDLKQIFGGKKPTDTTDDSVKLMTTSYNSSKKRKVR